MSVLNFHFVYKQQLIHVLFQNKSDYAGRCKYNY